MKGHAEGDVGFLQAVQAAVIQHGSIAGQQGIADVTQHDLAITQAGSHTAVRIAIAASLDQAGVFADHAGHSIGHDAGGIAGDGVHSVEALVAFSHIVTESGQFTATDGRSFGIGADDSA